MSATPGNKSAVMRRITPSEWVHVPGRAGAFGQACYSDPDDVIRKHTFIVKGWLDENEKPCRIRDAIFALVRHTSEDFLIWLE